MNYATDFVDADPQLPFSSSPSQQASYSVAKAPGVVHHADRFDAAS